MSENAILYYPHSLLTNCTAGRFIKLVKNLQCYEPQATTTKLCRVEESIHKYVACGFLTNS